MQLKQLLKFLWLLVKESSLRRSFWYNARQLRRLTRVKEVVHFVALTEHLGDIVAAEPCLRWLREHRKGQNLIWVCRTDYLPLAKTHPAVSHCRHVPDS